MRHVAAEPEARLGGQFGDAPDAHRAPFQVPALAAGDESEAGVQVAVVDLQTAVFRSQIGAQGEGTDTVRGLGQGLGEGDGEAVQVGAHLQARAGWIGSFQGQGEAPLPGCLAGAVVRPVGVVGVAGEDPSEGFAVDVAAPADVQAAWFAVGVQGESDGEAVQASFQAPAPQAGFGEAQGAA